MTDFNQCFGHAPEVITSAHGRVNLIGEHTDYNEGFVLPMQIPQTTRVCAAGRTDRIVRVFSELFGTQEYVLGKEFWTGTWIDYVQGTTAMLRTQPLSGFDACIDSRIPSGSGLSSSAALEIAMLRALRQVFHLSIDDLELARIAHQAEYDFVGARVGMMDQMVVSLGNTDSAFFLDTRSLEYKAIPLPDSVEIVVLDSGISHANREGNYNMRRSECEEACRLLGIRSLRELSASDDAKIQELPLPYRKRAWHVVSENDRVLRSVECLKHNDPESFGRLLNESHASLRDDYEVSLLQIDGLVQVAREQPDAYGARMTGGGFGGAILIAVKKDHGTRVVQHLVKAFKGATPLIPEVK